MLYRVGSNINESNKEKNLFKHYINFQMKVAHFMTKSSRLIKKIPEDCTFLDLNLHEIDHIQVANESDVPLKAPKNVKDSNLAIEMLRSHF